MGCHKLGVPQNRLFLVEKPNKIDDFGVSLFQETSIYSSTNQTCHVNKHTLLVYIVGYDVGTLPSRKVQRTSFSEGFLKAYHWPPGFKNN